MPSPSIDTPTVLVTSIGTARDYEETVYRLGEQEHRTRFASVALARTLGLRGGRALVLVTAKAHEMWYARLADALREEGLEPTAIPIPDGRNGDEILAIFNRLVFREGPEEAGPFLIAPGSKLVLDVTFALRHLPFVYLAALSYLVGLHDVRIGGIYYGAFELREAGGAAPLLDITTQFDLIEWYHALRNARQSGDLARLTDGLNDTLKALHVVGESSRELGQARKALRKLSAALAAGLPIEVGIYGQELKQATAQLELKAGRDSGARLALRSLLEPLEAWALPAPAEEKVRVELTAEELQRQLQLAQWYVERGNVPNALLVLREWMVSYVMHRDPFVHPEWLDYNAERKPAENYLNGLAYRAKLGLATEPEKALAGAWRGVADLRNKMAHAGHHKELVSVSEDKVRNALADCRRLLEASDSETEIRYPKGRLVITPLGLSPGVVFTLQKSVPADHLLVITSAQARPLLAEALAKARTPDVPLTVRELPDPFQGFRAAAALARDEEIRHLMLRHWEVITNLTGGTTAMPFAVERLAEESRRLGVTTRRVALIDRRSIDEQRAHPYVVGEVVWVDDECHGEDEREN